MKLGVFIGIMMWAGAVIASPDMISLRLNFPQQFAASVVDSRIEASGMSDKFSTSSILLRYTVRGVKSGAGTDIYSSSGKVDVESGVSPTLNAFFKTLLELSNRNFPVTHVDSNGALTIPDFQKHLKSTVRSAKKSAPTAETSAMVDRIFSGYQIVASAQDQWMRMVQMWNGVDVKLGTWYQATGREYVPQLGEVVDSDYFFRVMTRVPCYRGAPCRDCVLIEAKSVPNTSQVHSVIAKVMGVESPSSENTKIVTSFSVVTDPKTLLPYLYHESRESVFGDVDALAVYRVRYMYTK
jgi:hypothetical protein